MITPTTPNAEHPSQTRSPAPPRLVVWVELPRQAADARPTPASGQAAAREPWYDPAAVYEEPERWDGMA